MNELRWTKIIFFNVKQIEQLNTCGKEPILNSHKKAHTNEVTQNHSWIQTEEAGKLTSSPKKALQSLHEILRFFPSFSHLLCTPPFWHWLSFLFLVLQPSLPGPARQYAKLSLPFSTSTPWQDVYISLCLYSEQQANMPLLFFFLQV